MAASDLTAAQVMAKSASLLNDTARTNYTYAAQLPYLQIALQELQEHFQLNDIPTVQLTSAIILVDAGFTEITYNAVFPFPALPNDLIEPSELWEGDRGATSFIPLTRKEYLPKRDTANNTQFGIYTWSNQKITLLPCVSDKDVKIDYIKQLFENIVDENSLINIVNARTFLEYRTAALCAEFIERNKTSSDALNVYAVLGSDRATGITIKGKQNISTRRRPFRSAYKRRGGFV